MMSAVSTYPAHVSDLRRKNTWYTACDGNWSNPTTWRSNGRRIHNFPQAGDDVVISHNISADTGIYVNFVYSINNLTVSGKLSFIGGWTFNVMGNLLADAGTIDFTASNASFNMYGPITNFGTLLPGTSGLIGFWGNCTQYISKPLVGDFYNLYITNPAYTNGGPIVTKYITYNMTNPGSVTVYLVSLELGNNNIVFSTGGFTNNGGLTVPAISRKGTGTTVFTGICTALSGMDVGSNSVEFRNGLTIGVGGGGTINASQINFTTNNQSLKGLLTTTSTTPILIASGVTVTLDGSTNTNLTLGSTINGVDATSTFYCNSTSYITLSGPATDPMVTGVWNMQGSIYYSFSSGNFVIKQPSYVNLGVYMSNNCTYTLGTDVIVSVAAAFYQSNLDLGSYNLTINGTMGFQTFQLKRSGTGNTVVKGLLTYNGSSALSFGTNVLEIQAGMATSSASDTNNWTLGTLLISTANQSFARGIQSNTLIINGNIEIAAGLTLTNLLPNLTINGVLNGDNSASTFNNQNGVNYANAQQPMQIGVLQCTTTGNTFIYGLAGSQDVTPGTYVNLTLKGSGAKRLLGNVLYSGSYALTPPATLNSNGFSLTFHS